MLKHLYYLLRSDYRTIRPTDFDDDFRVMGLPLDNNVNKVESVLLDYLGVEIVNAPTLFTSFEDFMEHLHYALRANSLKLYYLRDMLQTITADYLKADGGIKRTLEENTTGSDTKSGSDTNTTSGTSGNFRKYADTPTKVQANSDFVDSYTTEQEKIDNQTSGTSKTIYDTKKDRDGTRKIEEETFNTTNIENALANISSLNEGLYNEVKRMVNGLLYQLLYPIDN